MQVTLDIPNKNHWEALVPLLKELNITFQVNEDKHISEEEQAKKDWEIIRKGIEVDDPEQFMKDFEESRKDRELPHHLL